MLVIADYLHERAATRLYWRDGSKYGGRAYDPPERCSVDCSSDPCGYGAYQAHMDARYAHRPQDNSKYPYRPRTRVDHSLEDFS